MATVKDQVAGALLGTEQPPQLTQQTRAAFMKHATKGEGEDDYFLDEDAFVDAVAPAAEDYVCTNPTPVIVPPTHSSASEPQLPPILLQNGN